MARYFTRKEYEKGSMSEMWHDFYSGVYVGVSHSTWMALNFAHKSIIRPIGVAVGLADGSIDPEAFERLSKLAPGEAPQLKVIGIGYGRTGTYSLTLALEELGFPTLHTQHLYESPKIMDMWANKVFIPSLEQNKATLGFPDFDVIAQQGFQATTDLPMALYFEQIMERYPNCKFILTTRENSEVWFKSWDVMTNMIKHPTAAGTFLPRVRQLGYYLRWLFSTVNRDDKYLTHPLPLPGQIKENAIASYEEHNRRVREVVPPERLLEYSVTQGYRPLCEFLSIPSSDCPTQPFPKSNSARSVKVQAISSMIFPLIVSLLLVYSLVASVFRQMTGQPFGPWLREKRHNTIFNLCALHVRKQKKMSSSKSRVEVNSGTEPSTGSVPSSPSLIQRKQSTAHFRL